MRNDACHYLGMSASPEAVPYLRARLEDSDPGVVEVAQEALDQAKAALDLFRLLGVQNTDCRPAGAKYGTDGVREHYILNPTLAGVEEADALLLVGVNPTNIATMTETATTTATATTMAFLHPMIAMTPTPLCLP